MTRNFKDLDFLVEKMRNVDDGNSHIFITGDIKVGKSTLLKSFLEKYYSNAKIDGVMTELVIRDKFRIELFRYGDDNRIIVGERSIDAMDFFDEVFIEQSCKILDNLKENIDILIFDEIGNKEIHLEKYSDKLISLFEKYRIFAVLKKAGNPIFNNLDRIRNYIIFDLDKFYE